MRSDDYTTSVPGPVLDIQTGIVLGEKGIACIAENTFHEIKVGHATAGSKKPHLKRLFPDETLHARADDGTKQKGKPSISPDLLLPRQTGRSCPLAGGSRQS